MYGENSSSTQGISNSEGIVEFNEKKYFPTFYDTPIFTGTDEMGHETGEFNLSDITDGLFNIILKDSENSEILTISNIELIDGINIINISLDGNYELTHQEGDFNIQLLLTNESDEPEENISAFIQYSCNPNHPPCSRENFNDSGRPSVTFGYFLCSESNVQIIFSYLDGTIIEEINQFSQAGSHTINYSPPDPDEISGGLQGFKYSIILDEGACSSCNDGRNISGFEYWGECSIENARPNPFN